MTKGSALELLRQMLDPSAEFRDGQWEAPEDAPARRTERNRDDCLTMAAEAVVLLPDRPREKQIVCWPASRRQCHGELNPNCEIGGWRTEWDRRLACPVAHSAMGQVLPAWGTATDRLDAGSTTRSYFYFGVRAALSLTISWLVNRRKVARSPCACGNTGRWPLKYWTCPPRHWTASDSLSGVVPAGNKGN